MAPGLYFFFALLPALSLGNLIKIPPSFPDGNLGSYEIRYLSGSEGSDGEGCLSNQSLAPTGNASACKSLQYVLTGESFAEEKTARVRNLSKVVILVAPGEYFFNGGIDVLKSNNVIIAKDPRLEGEVVFSCSSLQTRFNNLYFKYVEHVALIGVTCNKCGLIVGTVAFERCRNVFVSECLFR